MSDQRIELQPIGRVRASRSVTEDDYWGGAEASSVLDVKPVMQEFLPRSTVVQPVWSHELMQHYWEPGESD